MPPPRLRQPGEQYHRQFLRLGALFGVFRLDFAGHPAVAFQLLRRDRGALVEVFHGLPLAPLGITEDPHLLWRQDNNEFAHAWSHLA